MIKVVSHGQKRIIENPRDPKLNTVTIPVTFEEKGRGGLNLGLSETSALLSEFVGANVGLDQFRTHTFSVKADQIDKFPIGKELPFFINRKLTSTSQMRQQDNVEARNIDGKLTYVSTYLSRDKKDDIDERVSLEVSAQIDPERVKNARTSVANVTLAPVAEQAVVHEELTQ